MENSEIVLNTLKENGKPMRAGEISALSGIEKTEVEKHIKKLVKEDKVFSPVRCCYQSK